MDTLILEDFRCFADRHEVPIRPLTLLVGENSTGKTSFLAAVRAAHDARSRTLPDFNEDPFQLGSYDQIANYRGDQHPVSSFKIGHTFKPQMESLTNFTAVALPHLADNLIDISHMDGAVFRFVAQLAARDGQPIVSSLSIMEGDYDLRLDMEQSGSVKISFFSRKRIMFEQQVSKVSLGQLSQGASDIWFMLRMATASDLVRESDMNRAEAVQLSVLVNSSLFGGDPRPHALAPIRSRPRRTYDPMVETKDPEGSHIPAWLARTYGDVEFKNRMFKNILDEFGVESGLYDSLTIRKFGHTGSEPFQVEVRLASDDRERNLIDVGYGVSQAIPIIADALSTETGTTLLIQQPEVHLHPRAQAAMGSFFVQLAASEHNRLVVETHSDYLVDRVRMDVREGKIKASDVVILYFEQGSQGVGIHPITIDAMGNLENTPASYGGFFLEEQRRFFMID